MPDIRVRSNKCKWDGWGRHTDWDSFSKDTKRHTSGVKASNKDTKKAFITVKALAIKRKRGRATLQRLPMQTTKGQSGVPKSSAAGHSYSTPPDMIKSKVVSAPVLSPMSVETDLPSNLRVEVLRQVGEHHGTIVALHPHRCTSGEFLDARYFKKLMEAGLRIVLPNARFRLESWRQRELGANVSDAEGITHPSWFLYPDATVKQDKETMLQTAAELEGLLLEERHLLDRDTKKGSKPRPLLILGESQGGVQATATYLRTKVKVQGLMCLVSHPPCELDRGEKFHKLMFGEKDVNNFSDKKAWPMIFFNYYGKAGGDAPSAENDEWWSDNTFHFKQLVEPSLAAFKELMGAKCKSYHWSGGDHDQKKSSPTVFREMYEHWCNILESRE
jgi:hypothetical protein